MNDHSTRGFKRTLPILVIFLSCIAKASIEANISPQSVTLGENVQLTLTVADATKVGSPNLMPLLKDFEVLSTERGYSFANINGKTSSKTEWALVLRPKHAGTITIPPLSIGTEQSKAITINVSTGDKQGDNTYTNTSTYTIMKVAINEKQPFINQQTLYTVKLYNRQKLFNGQYKAPEVENALMVPLSDGKSYQSTIKNEIYNVEEISYAIFPQKTGKITIIPPEFTAEVIDGFNPTQIHLSAKPISINVKPLSAEKKISDWLAAESVTINEEYDNPAKTFVEGDILIRNITIKASGMVAQLLPKLTFKSNSNYNVYANKPHIENNIIDGKIVATATYKVTYLLTKTANTQIPSIKIPWYNINSKADMVATLPSKTITVGQNKKSHIINKTFKVTEEIKSKSQSWLLPITGLLIILITVLGAIKFKSKINLSRIISKILHQSRSESSIEKSVASLKIKGRSSPLINNIQKACKASNPTEARQAILDFARQEWPDLKILNLNNIPVENQEFKQEIIKLTAALYSKSGYSSWDGDKLWRIFSRLKIKIPNKKTKKTLPPIYLH